MDVVILYIKYSLLFYIAGFHGITKHKPAFTGYHINDISIAVIIIANNGTNVASMPKSTSVIS